VFGIFNGAGNDPHKPDVIKVIPADREHIREIAYEITLEAFRRLDIATEEDFKDARRDLEFARKWRTRLEVMTGQMIKIVFAFCLLGLLAFCSQGVIREIKHEILRGSDAISQPAAR
jgi:hypothetical protein